MNVDNLRLDGNTLSSTDTNGNVQIDPDGAGLVDIVGSVRSSDLTSGRVPIIGTSGLVTDDGDFLFNTTGNVLTVTNGQWNIDNLRADGNTISSTNTNGNVQVDPDGTGVLDVVGSIVSSALTNGRVLIAGASGLITDSANLLYDTATGIFSTPAIRATSTTQASRPNNPMTTAQRLALTPGLGDCVYDTDIKSQLCYDGANWALQGVQPNDTSWTSYTPTLTNFTASSIECQYRYHGQDQLVRCKMTNTSNSAGEARISLADNATSADTSVIPSIQVAGEWFLGSTSTSHGGAILIEPSVGYFTVGSDGTFSNVSVNSLTKQNAATIWGNNPWSFTARVPVANRASSIGTYTTPSYGAKWIKFYNDSGCSPSTTSTAYTSLVDTDCDFATATKAAGVVTPTTTGGIALKLQNVPKGTYRVWFAGVLNTTSGGADICAFRVSDGANIVGPFYNENTSQVNWNDPSIGSEIVTYSTDQATVEWLLQARSSDGNNTCGALAFNDASSIYIAMEPVNQVITATLRDVPTYPSSPTGTVYNSTAHFGGGGAGVYNSVCSSSPCTVQNDIGDITTVTRAGTGDYTINFARTYTALNCVFGVRSANDPIANPVQAGSCASCNSVRLLTVTRSSGAADDVYSTVQCTGY